MKLEPNITYCISREEVPTVLKQLTTDNLYFVSPIESLRDRLPKIKLQNYLETYLSSTETDAEVVEVLPASYSTIGLTNESVVPVILRVNENVNEGQCTEDSEKIEPYWVTREEAAEILKSSDIAARAQLAIRMFVKGCL